jgi:spermidine/putrescine transport system permease protein
MKRMIPKDRLFVWVLVGPLVLWLLALFLAPLIVIFARSFWIEEIGQVVDYFSLENWVYFLVRPAFGRVLLKSIGIGLSVVAISLAFGYPMAYLVARKIPANYQTPAMTVLLFPFLTSHVVRIFGWMTILGRQGFINTTLISLGVIQEPLDILLYNTPSLLISLAYVLMPLMIMPCNIALSRIDPSLMQASSDLGANAFQTFFRITLPLSKPGIVAGFLLVFVPATGAYFEPLLLGGTRGVMIGNIVANHFTGAIMWSRGCALAFLVIFLITLLVVVFLKLVGGAHLMQLEIE